mmetsp:Transcript_11281/g.47056  ORF Transcript_11281/g.47056 Transcript_11281/m.47056 type:complete len:389 (-) Transcript_11281:1989-3155(-)
MGARRVPWSDWEEWWEAIDGLLKWEESPDDAKRALERVCAWRARSVLSVAVDGVASLVEVLLQPACETTRLAMGLVLTRVVNALTEKEQSGRIAAPLSVLGAALGLPEGLVELRHDVTHNALPTLAAMRTSSRQCLSFLYETYILPQYELSMSRDTGTISNLAENEAGDFGSTLRLEAARLSQAHQADDQRAARDAFDILISMLEKSPLSRSTRPDQALWTTIRALMPLAHKEDAREVINRCASVLNLPAAQKARFESLIEISEPDFFHAVRTPSLQDRILVKLFILLHEIHMPWFLTLHAFRCTIRTKNAPYAELEQVGENDWRSHGRRSSSGDHRKDIFASGSKLQATLSSIASASSKLPSSFFRPACDMILFDPSKVEKPINLER